MTPPRRRTLILFTTTALAIAVTACSGSGAAPDPGTVTTQDGGRAGGQEPGTGAPDDPVALIRSVSQQVADIGSFRMSFEMAIEARGTAIAATGDGEFSADPPSMHTTYRFDQLPGMPDGAEMELILDGTTMYMRMPALAGSAGIPTEWVSMDIEQVAPGFDGLLALSQGQNDPTSSLAYLDGITDAEEIGTETVAGVTTTHYHGTVDPPPRSSGCTAISTPTRGRRSRRRGGCWGRPRCPSTCGSTRKACCDA